MFSFQGAFWSLIVAIIVAAIRIMIIFIYRAPEGKQIIENIPFPEIYFKSPTRRHLNLTLTLV